MSASIASKTFEPQDKKYPVGLTVSIISTKATHATCLEKKRAKSGYWKIASKKVFDLSEEQIKLIRNEVQKYQNRLSGNKNTENINKED